MIARMRGSEGWDVARAEYVARADRSKEKSSSAVQDVGLTMSFQGDLEDGDRSVAYWAVSGRRDRKAVHSWLEMGLKSEAGRSCRVDASTP